MAQSNTTLGHNPLSRDISPTSTRVDHSYMDLSHESERRRKELNAARASDDQAYPEGGSQAWLTLFGGFLLQYASFGYANAFGVYQDYYVRFYLAHYTPSQIGWIGGTQLFFTFSSGVVVGRMFDQGHFRALTIAGVILHAISLYTLSLTQVNSFYQVYLTHGLCFGISSGLLYIPSLGIVGHYFQRRRALALGIVSSGSALGAVLHPIMLNRLMTTTTLGFRNTVRISASLNVALLIIGVAVMRTRLPPKPLRRFPILKWLREPAYFCAFVASAFIFLGLFYPVFYIQLLSYQKGVSPTLAFYTVSILNAASFVGRVVPSALSPQLGVVNMELFALLASGFVVCFMSLVKGAPGAIIIGILFGFFSGAAISLVASVVGLLALDTSELGTRLGLVFAIGGLFGLFATPITGELLTSEYHWLNASLFSGISLMIAGVLCILLRYYLIKSRGTSTWVI